MAINFIRVDVLHRIIVKFFPAYLPTAKKKFYARPVMQEVLDIHGIASKAEVYNITTSPKVIEEGLLAAISLVTYLLADNYKIDLEVLRLSTRIPGEFEGTETHLPEGISPEVRVVVDDSLRKYIKEHAKVQFDGIEDTQGYIGDVLDVATGRVDEVVTRGNIVAINGYGLKVEADEAHASQVGVFLVTGGGFERDVVETPVTTIAVNEPRTLKVLIPTTLQTDKTYQIVVRTQCAIKGRYFLKDVRTVTTDFPLSVL